MSNTNPLPREYSALNAAAHAVREHAAAAPAKAAIELLDAIELQYLDELRTVPMERLQRLQGTLAQLGALRRVFQGDANFNGVA